MILCNQLNRFITEKGIKQVHLSRKTGMAPDIVSKILKGKRKITAEEFLLICDALEIDPNMFRKNKGADS